MVPTDCSDAAVHQSRASLQSNIVYKYSYLHVGETTRHLRTRISEHRGLSPRSGLPVGSKNNSNIYAHYIDTGHDILPSQFEIVGNQDFYLKIAESLIIHKTKPKFQPYFCSSKYNLVFSQILCHLSYS